MAKAESTTHTRRATLFGAAALASVAITGSAKASPISPEVQKAFDDWQNLQSVTTALDEATDRAGIRRAELMPACPASLIRKNLKIDLTWAHTFCLPVAFSGSSDPQEWRATAKGLRKHLEWLQSFQADADRPTAEVRAVKRLIATAEDYEAAISAAEEMSGLYAAETAASDASDAAHAALLRFLALAPQTMADVRLQAKHLLNWLDGVDLERPIDYWLTAIIDGTQPALVDGADQAGGA